MANVSYIELLKDPRWQRKRLEILQRDEFTCQGCAETTKTLHVHHKRYHRGKKPWEYEDADLVTLCEPCHEKVTATKKLLESVIGDLSSMPGTDGVVLGFAEALVASIAGPSKVYVRDGDHAAGIACFTAMTSRAGQSLLSAEKLIQFTNDAGFVDLRALALAIDAERGT